MTNFCPLLCKKVLNMSPFVPFLMEIQKILFYSIKIKGLNWRVHPNLKYWLRSVLLKILTKSFLKPNYLRKLSTFQLWGSRRKRHLTIIEVVKGSEALQGSEARAIWEITLVKREMILLLEKCPNYLQMVFFLRRTKIKLKVFRGNKSRKR